ncbi:MAG: FAD-dependent oxidoreductase, partial [Myxococcales bacterium]|nr:FAD-dependent oxidoreductase [Myxococcales bacterium]
MMEPCWSVLSSFVVRLPIDLDGIFVHDSPLRWAARDSSKPRRVGTEEWVLHADEAWSRTNLDAANEDVLRSLTEAFFRAVGVPARSPAFASLHRWRYATPRSPQDREVVVDRDR